MHLPAQFVLISANHIALSELCTSNVIAVEMLARGAINRGIQGSILTCGVDFLPY